MLRTNSSISQERRRFARQECFVFGQIMIPALSEKVEGFLENISQCGCLFRPRIRKAIPENLSTDLVMAGRALEGTVVKVSDHGIHFRFHTPLCEESLRWIMVPSPH